MSAPLLDSSTLKTFRDRIERVPPDAERRWGTMDLAKTFSHLCRSVEVSLGAVEVKDQSNFLSRTVLKWLVFQVLPWPKGKIKAPSDSFVEDVGNTEQERQALLDALGRFVETAEREPERKATFFIFGPVPLRYWRRIHGKHLDHHLRQFGA